MMDRLLAPPEENCGNFAYRANNSMANFNKDAETLGQYSSFENYFLGSGRKKLSVVSDYRRVIPVSDRDIALVAVGDRVHTGVDGVYAELSNIIRPIPKK
jgi:hypothetical protein